MLGDLFDNLLESMRVWTEHNKKTPLVYDDNQGCQVSNPDSRSYP